MKCKLDTCTRESEGKSRPILCVYCRVKEWRSRNRDRTRKNALDRYYKNREKILEKNKTEEVREYKRKWHHKNKSHRTEVIVRNRRKTQETTEFKWNALIVSAKKRGYEVLLTFDEFKQLLTNKCFYCESEMTSTSYGLDRTDNNKGYSKDNLVRCCKICNRVKGQYLSQEEMLELVNLLRKKRNKTEIWK